MFKTTRLAVAASALLLMAGTAHAYVREADQPAQVNTGGACPTAMDAHNVLRAKHGLQGLTWDDNLAQQATAYAQQLASTCPSPMPHDKGRGDTIGENLYSCKGWLEDENGIFSPANCGDCDNAAEQWYAEIKDHDFSAPVSGARGVTGHFTQMVWFDTKSLGCGKWVGQDCIVVVCRYNPLGNFYSNGKKEETYLCNIPPVGGWTNGRPSCDGSSGGSGSGSNMLRGGPQDQPMGTNQGGMLDPANPQGNLNQPTDQPSTDTGNSFPGNFGFDFNNFGDFNSGFNGFN